MRLTVLGLLVFAFLLSVSFAADTVRVCSYNVLNYSLSNDDGRTPMYKAIMDEIKPDVLLCTEVVDNTMGPRFVTDVLLWAPFAASPFIDGPDTDCQIFYDQQKFDFISQKRIPTELRDIAEFILITKHNDGLPEDTVAFYTMHLKASDGAENESARMLEVQRFRAGVGATPYVVVGGDMNFYSPSERGYSHFHTPPTGRTFIDPLGTSWSRNNATWAHTFTQCTRLTNAGSCGGGVDGGIDDRFDFILTSPQLVPRVITSSYTAFGNDGAARLNKSINSPANTIVSQEIADALHCASDHLPIYVDIVLGNLQADVNEQTTTSETITVNGNTVFVNNAAPNTVINVYSIQGTLVRTSLVNSPNERINLSNMPTGVYAVKTVSALKLVIVD